MDRYQIIRIIHDYMSRYDKKNKSDSQNVFGCRSLFFFLFLLWVEFSLYPYQKGFILPLIQFPIFR